MYVVKCRFDLRGSHQVHPRPGTHLDHLEAHTPQDYSLSQARGPRSEREEQEAPLDAFARLGTPRETADRRTIHIAGTCVQSGPDCSNICCSISYSTSCSSIIGSSIICSN